MITLLSIIRVYWLPFSLFILTVNTILSLYPLESLPSVPGSDKSHHFIAYAALIFPAALKKPKYLPFIGVFFVGWSGAIELMQPYANRYGEWLDLAANTGGVVCGFLIAQVVNWVFNDHWKANYKNNLSRE